MSNLTNNDLVSKKEKMNGKCWDEKLISGCIRWIKGEPITSSIVVMLILVALTFIPAPKMLSQWVGGQSSEYIAGILEQLLASVLLIYGVKFTGNSVKGVFALKSRKIWVVWPILIFILLIASDFLLGKLNVNTKDIFLIITYITVYLTTGLFEELLCRGFVFQNMIGKWGSTQRGCYGAMILSSLFFGLFHFIHFILGHASLLATFGQIIYATFIGVFFAACVIKTKSLLPAILLHGLLDIAGSLREITVNGGINKAYRTMSLEDVIISSIFVLPLFIYGLIIVKNDFQNGMMQEDRGID